MLTPTTIIDHLVLKYDDTGYPTISAGTWDRPLGEVLADEQHDLYNKTVELYKNKIGEPEKGADFYQLANRLARKLGKEYRDQNTGRFDYFLIRKYWREFGEDFLFRELFQNPNLSIDEHEMEYAVYYCKHVETKGSLRRQH